MISNLPDEVCFRVTRVCNARCGFCLAPPDGLHPSTEELAGRIDWLLERGVRTIHFCGGEPTIHPGLLHLIQYVQERGGKSELTTNAIAFPGGLPDILRAAHTPVKVSLHGSRAHHDRIVGVKAFERTTAHLRELVAAGVTTSVQTTIVSGALAELDWVVQFCLESGVRRLSILPFIPRGSGYAKRSEYTLSATERCLLRETVTRRRRALSGRLEVRWLDFSARPIHVVEPDGRLVLEGAMEGMDQVICQIPANKHRLPQSISAVGILPKPVTSAIIETIQGA